MCSTLEGRAALLRVMTRLRPKNVKAWRSLASVHLKISRQPIRQRSRARHKRLAAAAGRRALHLAPEERLRLLRRLTRRCPGHPMAFLRTAEVLVQLGAEETDETDEMETWRDEAADALRRHLDIAEGLRGTGQNERKLRIELAKHLLCVVTGETPEVISKDYVSNLFDRFSKTFERSLDNLNYQVPQLIMQALRWTWWDFGCEPSPHLRALDLGAGTGLLGEQLRDWAPRAFLEGLDLSAAMLQQAEKKGCYDLLHHKDICDFLEAADEEIHYDLITAADVFVYVTALEPILRQADRKSVV